MATNSNLGKNSRLYLLGAMLLFWCVAICGRLVYLQIFRYGSFVKQAEHQQQREIPLSAKRGVIYDRAGHELAMSVLVDSAFAVPTEVKDLPTAVSLITRITGEDHNVVLADCRNHKTFCWVARKADDETIERIKSLNLQGIHFQKEPKRFYPARDLAAQVVGTVGMEDSGQSGIEHAFDDELRGRAGKMFISVDARRQWFSDVEKQPEPGENLVLTIDKNIQYIAEKELDQAIHDTQAIAGTVIVENPHTGEILALANRPTFNPNLRKADHAERADQSRGELCVRAGIDLQAGNDFRGARREAHESGRSVRLPDGIDRLQRHAHSRLEAARPVCRCGACWRSRATWARSRLHCGSAKTGSTNTFAPLDSDSRRESNCRARRAG